MNDERRTFDLFVKMHGNKATATSSPTAHVHFFDGTGIPADCPLVQMTREDVLQELDKESRPVQWLLKQMTTYECERQKLLCLVFDRSRVVSDVYWVQTRTQDYEDQTLATMRARVPPPPLAIESKEELATKKQ